MSTKNDQLDTLVYFTQYHLGESVMRMDTSIVKNVETPIGQRVH